ncbi:hypothetical protein A4D02_21235 [Niastella koreensis]|uniref:HtrA2 peptidase n=2 Tax=Niastella koreensis TaxID=354356 RepID=G8TJ90_NIAKG|nr:trypsin-like peptidase domain-containing protein [Niastella koreensis]AEV98623.1 HtrA2 peptidase [Niastella koreensis GR20-10]OQP52935.1 hypothetical protein A4D02_21235 [Niastella koreensis]
MINRFLIILLAIKLLWSSCFGQGTPLSFRFAASKATPAVVHIRSYFSEQSADYGNNNFWYHFFAPDKNNSTLQVGNASGVIVRADGYIVTNKHVVDKAQKIEIILPNKQECIATVVGTDAATDLALLKIDQNQLQKIEFGKSDSIEVGDIVLAVGNPFNLASTVTAGIVSAKARNIKLLGNSEAVDSYIQTDAAVNPGNSGGALIDINGKLIGINCAIATTTGAYAGYSFAIPVEIVKKTIDDLLKYGKVMRGYLGIIASEMNWEKAKMLGLSTASGVLIDSIQENGAAMKAGVQKNDLILDIDNHKIETLSQLQETIARYKPGENIQLTVNRSGNEKVFVVTLSVALETKDHASKDSALLKTLGITVEKLSASEKKQLGVPWGVKVVAIDEGIIPQSTSMQKGFVILVVNKKRIRTTTDFFNAMKADDKLFIIGGVYPGSLGIYYYTLEKK